MEVEHLLELADWYEEYAPSFVDTYQGLLAVLDNNASQSPKQPVRDHLNAVVNALESLPIEELNSDQIGALTDWGLLQFLGSQGVEFVTRTVTQGEYDPASTAADVKAALRKLTDKRKQMAAAKAALNDLDFESADSWTGVDSPIVRVHFQDEAAIADVQLLKKWSNEWYDIARGVALAAGESPNDVKVIGASNGSIILTLAATYPVARLLAAIAKQVGSIVREGLQISMAIEDLRQKRLLTKSIELELNKQRDELADNGIENAVKEVLAVTGRRTNGETETALRKSIEKYANFTRKGGDVDFLSPPAPGHTDVPNDSSEIEKLTKEHQLLRETIEQVRDIQNQVRMLSHERKKDGSV